MNDIGLFLFLGGLIVGFALGIVVTRAGFFIGFREHLDKHYHSQCPDRDCVFCLEERSLPWNTDGA